MAETQAQIQRNFLWWITRDDSKLAIAKLDRSTQEVETLEETYDVKYHYAKYPATLIGKDITTAEPEIPERYQLALVDWVLQNIAKNSKETLALSNYYRGHWEHSIDRAKRELNTNKGAEHNVTRPVDF